MDEKKFLDQQGVSTLWGEVVKKLNAEIAVEAGRASAAETKLTNDLNALNTKVGTLPETTSAGTVVAYIEERTADIASGTAMTALTERVTQAESDIDEIEKDYLTSANEEALTKLINDEASRADAAEKVNAAAIDAIAKDYLKAEHKTALENAIALKADATALEQEVTDRTNAVNNLQTQLNTIVNNPDAEGAINSINEFTQYIADHGEVAEGFRSAIADNATAIGNEKSRAEAAEGALAARIKVVEDIDHDFATADTALKEELVAQINLKADNSAMVAALAEKATNSALEAVSNVANAAATKVYVDEELAKKATVLDLQAEVTARQNSVKANSDAITAIKDHANVDSFADVMAEVEKKQNIIPANTYDVYGSAAQALVDSKNYTNTELAKIQALSTADILNAIANASV